MEGNGFSYNHVGELTSKYITVNEPKGSSTINLKCKNVTIIPKNIDDRCLQNTFMLTQLYQEIKNLAERVSNMKPFIDLYIWNDTKNPTAIDNKNYALFERTNSGNCFRCTICLCRY